MPTPCEVRTYDESLAYLDALERSYDIAREARSREYDEWWAGASDEERLASIDLATGFSTDDEGALCSDDDAAASATEALAAMDRRRDARRRRYMKARFVLPGERQRPLRQPRAASGGRPKARRTRAEARSSSRGGDSGDDGPSAGGDSEPPPAPPDPLDPADCPCCDGVARLREDCPLCLGLGLVDRRLRNRWERGLPPPGWKWDGP